MDYREKSGRKRLQIEVDFATRFRSDFPASTFDEILSSLKGHLTLMRGKNIACLKNEPVSKLKSWKASDRWAPATSKLRYGENKRAHSSS